jgi:transcriptional regulator with XRE-family HTH domain
MSFQKVLGEVLRNVRLRNDISHEDLAGVINASHLRKVEKGLAMIKLDSLATLCKALGLNPSQVLLVVEARLSGHSVEAYLAVNTHQLRKQLSAGMFNLIPSLTASQGIRGQKAMFVRSEVPRLQAAGLTNAEVAKKLCVSVRTVQRYSAPKMAEDDRVDEKR